MKNSDFSPGEAAAISLADILSKLTADPDLAPSKKANLASSLNTISRILNRPLHDLPADISVLRACLEDVHHVQAGISKKRLGNVKSDLRFVLELGSRPADAQRSERLLPSIRTNEWKAFLAGLETDWQRHTLARLANFCSAYNYRPEEMSDQILERYGAYLSDVELSKKPASICKRAAQTWNGAVTRLELPFPLLTIPQADRYRAYKLTDFPASFQQEVKEYLQRLSESNW